MEICSFSIALFGAGTKKVNIKQQYEIQLKLMGIEAVTKDLKLKARKEEIKSPSIVILIARVIEYITAVVT